MTISVIALPFTRPPAALLVEPLVHQALEAVAWSPRLKRLASQLEPE